MATLTETERKTLPLQGSANEVDALLSGLQATHTKPLWAQMTKLNPPEPNPTAIPHVWKYDEIRPQLLRAGELITEKQAERRVLMLINPARGKLESHLSVLRNGRCPRNHQREYGCNTLQMPHTPPIPSTPVCSW